MRRKAKRLTTEDTEVNSGRVSQKRLEKWLSVDVMKVRCAIDSNQDEYANEGQNADSPGNSF